MFYRNTDNTTNQQLNLKQEEEPEPLLFQNIPRQIYEDLSSKNLKLPFTFELVPLMTSWEVNNNDENVNEVNCVQTTLTNRNKPFTKRITVRTVQMEDVTRIGDMCVREYGSGVYTSDHFPIHNINTLAGHWFDRQWLRLLVELTTILKVLPNESQENVPNDYAVILVTIENQCSKQDTDEIIVGMIEVSRQPVIRDIIPTPFPIPLPMKQFYCYCRNLISPNTENHELHGWITNLLIVPEHRGNGYSKLLVKACEGIARSWDCKTINLHCDASSDKVDAQIAQKLYNSLGYRGCHNEQPMLNDSTRNEWTDGNALLPIMNTYSTQTDDATSSWRWMNNNADHIGYCNSDVVFIEGVPLLYLRKELR